MANKKKKPTIEQARANAQPNPEESFFDGIVSPGEEQEKSKQDIKWEKTFTNLFNSSSMYQKADISRKLALFFTQLEIIQHKSDSKLAKKFKDHYLRYSISIGRKGRQEMVQMMKSISEDEHELKEQTLKQKLFGL